MQVQITARSHKAGLQQNPILLTIVGWGFQRVKTKESHNFSGFRDI